MSLPLSYLSIRGVGDGGKSTRVQAVRIGCEGEVAELDVDKFAPVTISSHDDIFRDDVSTAGHVSELSRFIGLPVVARRCPIDQFVELSRANTEASALFRSCDIGSFDDERIPFGRIPACWDGEVGPVVVARLDRKPLHPLHAAAIAAFCSRYLRQSFQDCLESERVWRGRLATREYVYEQRRKVLTEATGTRFAEFFELYKQRRILGREAVKSQWHESFDDLRRMGRSSVPPDEEEPQPDWVNVPSPFDV